MQSCPKRRRPFIRGLRTNTAPELRRIFPDRSIASIRLDSIRLPLVMSVSAEMEAKGMRLQGRRAGPVGQSEP
jgi:hypothetical protein